MDIRYGLLVVIFPLVAQATDIALQTEGGGGGNLSPIGSFFKQSEIDISLKNYWKALNEEESGEKRIHNAWGQGATVAFHSGDIAGIFGVDATWNYVIKLGATDYFNSRGVLYSSGPESKKSNAAGFNKFGQRNLRMQYIEGDSSAKVRWGWLPLKDIGVISDSSRLSVTTYFGWYSRLAFGKFSLQGARVTKSMSRSSPDSEHFLTNDKKTIRALSSLDLRWNGAAGEIRYALGESSDYLSRHIFQASIKPTPMLTLKSQVYLTRALSHYREMPETRKDFDRRAQHFTIEARSTSPLWQTRWAASYTRAAKKSGVGTYPFHMSKNSRGTFNGMAKAGNDYNRDREAVLSGLVGYQLTPALTAGITGSIGRFSYQSVPVVTGEINAFTRWVMHQPSSKVLSLLAMVGPGWSYQALNGKTPKLVAGHPIRAKSFASEVILEYKFKGL
ncbi:OprD family outer membrane porin [Tatumella terrea]|uniref:OprD family outer membrane porin n=1 Tax=Tatumella terrea TaxID=419007 RepID=UPI0031D35FE8